MICPWRRSPRLCASSATMALNGKVSSVGFSSFKVANSFVRRSSLPAIVSVHPQQGVVDKFLQDRLQYALPGGARRGQQSNDDRRSHRDHVLWPQHLGGLHREGDRRCLWPAIAGTLLRLCRAHLWRAHRCALSSQRLPQQLEGVQGCTAATGHATSRQGDRQLHWALPQQLP